MSHDFLRWMESELDRGFAALSALPVPSEPRYRQVAGSSAGIFGRLAGSRLLAPILAAALIAGGGTAAAAAATGTNPVELGQQVSQAVVSCKEGLSSGEHGVGDCVSDFVLNLTDPVGRADREERSQGKTRVAPPFASPGRSAQPASPASSASSASSASPASIEERERNDRRGQSGTDNGQGRDAERGNDGRDRATDNPGRGAIGENNRGGEGRSGTETQAQPDERKGAADSNRGQSDGRRSDALSPGASTGRGSSENANFNSGGRSNERSTGGGGKGGSGRSRD